MDNLTNPKDLIGIKKPRLYTVPPASIIYQALAMQNGAEKYGAYNWRQKKVVASIYIDAALRHLFAWLDGEENATDSGLPHLAHALACVGIIVDAKETGNLVDDRPTPGASAKLIERYTKDGKTNATAGSRGEDLPTVSSSTGIDTSDTLLLEVSRGNERAIQGCECPDCQRWRYKDKSS